MNVSALRNRKDVSVHFSKHYSGSRLKGLWKSMETLSGDCLSLASERTWPTPSIYYTATYSMCYSYSNVINTTFFQIKDHLFCTGRKAVCGVRIMMEWTEDSINVKHNNKKLIIWIKTTAGAHMRLATGHVTFRKWCKNLIPHTHTRARARACVCVCVGRVAQSV